MYKDFKHKHKHIQLHTEYMYKNFNDKDIHTGFQTQTHTHRISNTNTCTCIQKPLNHQIIFFSKRFHIEYTYKDFKHKHIQLHTKYIKTSNHFF